MASVRTWAAGRRPGRRRVYQQDAGVEGKGLVGVVGRQDHAASGPFGRNAFDLCQHLRLVAEIEAGGGFVHDDQRGLLRQGAGDQDQLLCPPDSRE